MTTEISEKEARRNRALANLRKGGSPGRPKGVPNKATREIRTLCQRMLADKAYRANLRKRLRTGDAPPAVESMVWHYAYGKPPDKVELSDPTGQPLVFTLKLSDDAAAD